MMKSWIVMINLLIILEVVTGCSANRTYSIQINEPDIAPKSVKQIALFLDGTQNDRDSRTNVSVLNEIVKNQDKDNLYLFYNEGVGTDGKFIGAGTGWGIGKDVAEAYSFLSKYYTPDSKLYIFGFSRGAYTSRILAGMINSVGIIDLTPFDENDRAKISEKLFLAYKGENKKSLEENKANVNEIIEQLDRKLNNKIKRYDDVKIEAMGLWDTVEALGIIPTIEAIERGLLQIQDPQEIVNPNSRYRDQICNVKHIYHALSLDDNRANVFTPIIISSDHVMSKCNVDKDLLLAIVDEVWFSGAHSDIGGGYKIKDSNKNDSNKKGDNTDRDLSISGVSLNWMMSKLEKDSPGLLPEHAKVHENPLGYIHDAENHNPMYGRVPRYNILEKYLELSKYKKIRTHKSVVNRLVNITGDDRSKTGYDSEWYAKTGKLQGCFTDKGNGSYEFTGCPLIDIVE